MELSSWKNGSLKETFKLSSAYRQGWSVSYASQSSQCPKVSGGVMGNANETQVSVNGITVTTLLDTGSCVSTIGKSVYDKHLSHLELLPLNSILKLECADGQSLPYFGCIHVDIRPENFPTEHVQSSILLVVPDTEYNSNVPLLLGTNVLDEFLNSCKTNLGNNFLQTSNLHTPWYLAFRCIVVREKELKKNKQRLAIIKSAESDNISIPPNSIVTLRCIASKELNYRPTCAMLVPHRKICSTR